MSSQSISFRPAAVIRQLPWSLDKKAALGLLIILITFSLVGWLYLGQASVITSSTLEIEELQQQIEFLHQQNAEITLEIAELESIARIEARARDLGLRPTDPAQIRYLPVADYPLPDPPAAEPGAAVQSSPTILPAWQAAMDEVVVWLLGSSERDAAR